MGGGGSHMSARMVALSAIRKKKAATTIDKFLLHGRVISLYFPPSQHGI